jgi:XTP/dITP diphosphohydrolase
MQLIVATRNAHKTREFQQILGLDFAVRDLSDHPEIPETVERGETFRENAILKAIAASKQLRGLVVADDSGLEVDALGGAPGIYSARYGGRNATDKQNIDKLLGDLSRQGVRRNSADPSVERVTSLPYSLSARFRCVIALAREGELLGTFDGTVEGRIVQHARGSRGFGYDPIFVPNAFEQTFAELPAEMKNRISHRAEAIRALAAKLAALKLDDYGFGGGGGGGGAPAGGA